MHNFGIVYRNRPTEGKRKWWQLWKRKIVIKEGPLLLYKSYASEEEMAIALEKDEKVKQIDSDEIYLIDIRNCPLELKKEEDGGSKDGSKKG